MNVDNAYITTEAKAVKFNADMIARGYGFRFMKASEVEHYTGVGSEKGPIVDIVEGLKDNDYIKVKVAKGGTIVPIIGINKYSTKNHVESCRRYVRKKAYISEFS